jgi:hypothetical protein
MLALRADPWDPGFGMGFDAPDLEEGDRLGDAAVERQDWSEALRPGARAPGDAVCFVDGVRRVELRLIATEGGARAPGLFGSFAIGCVRAGRRAAFGEHEVTRLVVVGGGLSPDEVEVPVGAGALRFAPASVPGNEPDLPLRALQRRMREAEGAMAQDLAAESGALVLADGRLTFFRPSAEPVVGVVKRFSRHYLPAEPEELLGRIAPGERTPLFVLETQGEGVERYCWYTRLVPMRAHWHDRAGLVRCEVGASIGLERAVELADRVTALLPRFAGRPTDPRAPQNLMPVGALEARLRHRLGDEHLVRRALTEWLIGRGT